MHRWDNVYVLNKIQTVCVTGRLGNNRTGANALPLLRRDLVPLSTCQPGPGVKQPVAEVQQELTGHAQEHRAHREEDASPHHPVRRSVGYSSDGNDTTRSSVRPNILTGRHGNAPPTQSPAKHNPSVQLSTAKERERSNIKELNVTS